jgi:predicted nucleic acid-binding protein
MATNRPPRPRVFFDADVLFAGAASPSEHGASLVLLRLAELTLIKALTSEQVISETERNLAAKIPAALPAFRLLVSRCLDVVSEPSATERQLYAGLADAKDLSILVAALREKCPWLVTFNVRHFQPGHPEVTVLPPGDFLQRVRHLLANLS